MKDFFTIVVLILLIIVCGNIASAQLSGDIAAQLKSHIDFLSVNAMNGRFPGSVENMKAAEYISSKFKEAGLESFNGNFLMPFKLVDTLDAGKNSLVSFDVLIRKPGVPVEMLRPRTKTWITGKDWLPMRFSKNGSAKGEVAFCGYGVSSKETGYDDYAGMDVNGKIVIVLADSSEGLPLDDYWTPYSELSYKADNALEHGAAAVVFVKVLHDSANVFYEFDVDRNYEADIIAVQASRTLMAEFFPKADPMLAIEKRINDTKKPNSFILPDIKMSITTDVMKVEKEIHNVAGLVKGNDPVLKDEYIIVGANFDGLGAYWESPKWRPKVWTVRNSADYNASGTAAMLELAKKIATNPLKRSVIFIGFNAGVTEQEGAKAFIENPPVPKESIAFMLNLNTIGRLRNDRLYDIGGGTGRNFSDMLHTAKGQDSALKIIHGQMSFYPSDHLPFYISNIPAIMITSGMHTDVGEPSDMPEKIDYTGISRITAFSENLLKEAGNSEFRPMYSPDRTMTDYRNIKKGYKCWLGIVPDYETNLKGLVINDTYKNSPAAKAGIKTGDVILKFDGKEIKSYYDLETAQSLTKPGDNVQLLIFRDGTEKTINARVEKRK